MTDQVAGVEQALPFGQGPRFSVVAPLYNEEATVPELYRRLDQVMKDLGEDYELVFVDDGSTDSTRALLADLHEQDPKVRVVRLSRNFGHPIALAAGLDAARGELVFLVDGDLQNPPEVFPQLLEKQKEGYDLVYAVKSLDQAGLIRRQSAKLFWWLMSLLSGMRIPGDQLVLRLMTRRYVEALRSFGEASRFWGGMFVWVGFQQAAIEVKQEPRYAGRSKFSILRLLRLTLYAALAFSYVPLRLAAYLGFMISLMAFAALVVIISARVFLDLMLVGWLSLMTAILFMGGVQLIFLGVLGEYLGRVYTETKGRPLYIVEEVLE